VGVVGPAWLIMTLGCGGSDPPAVEVAPIPVAPMLVPPLEAGAPLQRELNLVLEGRLLDRDRGRYLEPMDLRLPAWEWRDADGRWHLELLEGTGSATGLGEAGPVAVPYRVRVAVFGDAPLNGTTAEGDRIYAVRGEVYFTSAEFPLTELEIVAAVRVPDHDGTWTRPERLSHPPLTPDAAAALARMGGMLDQLLVRGEGGSLITERKGELWGHSPGELPYYGLLELRSSSATTSARPTAERDADRLLGRLLYLRSDYPLAVRDAVVLDHVEYDEQLRLVQEMRVLGARLGVGRAARDALDVLFRKVTDRVPAAEIEAGCDEAARHIRAELALAIVPPDAQALAMGAPLYQQHCASCHGAAGEGAPAGLAEMDPPPAAFQSPAVAMRLSPRRAWNAVTFGIPGTAMAAWSTTLSEAERWALALHVVGLGAPAAPRPPGEPHRTLEDLVEGANTDLAPGILAGDPRPGWWRHGAIEAAAARPELAVRRRLHTAAREGRAETLWAEVEAALPPPLQDRWRETEGEEPHPRALRALELLSAAERGSPR
jgi:mono/diheme cytochrome c family protein